MVDKDYQRETNYEYVLFNEFKQTNNKYIITIEYCMKKASPFSFEF